MESAWPVGHHWDVFIFMALFKRTLVSGNDSFSLPECAIFWPNFTISPLLWTVTSFSSSTKVNELSESCCFIFFFRSLTYLIPKIDAVSQPSAPCIWRKYFARLLPKRPNTLSMSTYFSWSIFVNHFGSVKSNLKLIGRGLKLQLPIIDKAKGMVRLSCGIL